MKNTFPPPVLTTAPGDISAETRPYQYRGRDRVAETAVAAAARDGVRPCHCPHCCSYRAQHPVGAAR